MLYSHVTLLMLRVVDVVVKTTVQQSARMLVADIPGDIQIGALFPMHRQIAGAEGCGAVWEQYGIQRAEIAMLTVQELNKHLPFRLGISIRDSCWTERIAMEQTIAFLREGVTQCSCCQTAGCQKKANPVVAIVGPAKSSTTIAVQNLLQVFRIPQIGYGATTTDLSDKEQFGYYLRVVPSDVWQARAINQLLRHFNWTYIAVVYSAGNYGEKGFEALERLTHSPGMDVCIAQAQKVKSLANDKEFEDVLQSMLQLRPRPQVVVCFCEGLSMKKLFIAQRNLRKRNPNMRTFQWIGSDGWADRLDVVEGVEEDAAGSFSIRIHSPKVESFEPYYFALNPINHTINPWFREFWQQKFKCQLTVPKDDTVTPVCTGKENLTLNYEQDPKLSHVINSVRVVGFALKAMYNDKCRHYNAQNSVESGFSSASASSGRAAANGAYHRPKGSSAAAAYEGINGDEGSLENPVVESDELLMKNAGRSLLCPEMETINGTLLYKYMINVTFVDQFQQEISFDRNGDPPAWYDILNYVGPPEGFQLAGDFRQTRSGTHFLRMTNKPKLFFDKSSVLPESVCSKPCSVGQRQRQTTVCCWICEPCGPRQIVNYTTNKCQDCTLGQWPAPNRTSCFPLPHEYHEPTNASSLTALVFALIGILCTLIIIIFFINYSATPVVKSTTRELSFIILSGICACYVCTFVILARPSFATCFVSRTLPPIAFSVVYSALLTKTNRIARILAGSKKRILTKKPRFLTTFSQVVITWILVGVQCVIVAVGVMEEMPHAGFEDHFMPSRMVLICTSSSWAFMAPFVWNFLLILFCTLYAFKTRNLPENFNEAKFIGFTMYCTLVVWAAFVVLYFNAVNKALTMSFTFSISASIALVLLFFPKIFIIVLHPEKNVRSSYTTTKLIRCHFGNSQGMGDSKHLSSRTRTSLQSSTSMSYPTRTASLHVANNPSSDRDSPSAVTMAAGGGVFDPSANYGGASPIDSAPGSFQRGTSTHRQHSQHSHHSQYSLAGGLAGGGVGVARVGSVRYHSHSRREVGIQTSPVAEPTIPAKESPPTPAASVTSGGGGGPTSAASRFIRTLSVMGGGGHSQPLHHHRRRDVAAAMAAGDASAANRGAAPDDAQGTPSRRKTLDDDVLQLIDSCRRYQDERINSASTQMQNYLLEEEMGDEDEEHGGGHVSQMLAGSIERGMRTVFSTVSRTAAVGAPKLSTAGVGVEPPRPIYVPSLVVKTSQPPSIMDPPTAATARTITVFPRKKSSSASAKAVRGKSIDVPTTTPMEIEPDLGYESVRQRLDRRGTADPSVGHLPPPPPPPLARRGRRLSAVFGAPPSHNNRRNSAEFKPQLGDDIVVEDSSATAADEVILDEESDKAREFRQQQQTVEGQLLDQQQYADDIFEMGHTAEIVAAVKAKRRTLKNRGYALNCRVRRLQNKAQLEAENSHLRATLEQLTRKLRAAESQIAYFDRKTRQQP